MRLGDLDALKEAISYHCEYLHDNIMDLEDVLDLIDAAPTVEPTTVYEFKGCDSCELERPQGEWIDYSDEGYVECPFCQSATNCEDNKDELHYCFNCGAKLN